MMSTFLQPVVSSNSMTDFFKDIQSMGEEQFMTQLVNGLLSQQVYFITLMISLTFLSNSIYILDISKTATSFLAKLLTKKKEWEKEVDLEDKYYFDFGFNMAYMMTIFCIVNVNCVVVPVMNVLGFLFFLFKYHIDKYNLLYVYPTEYWPQKPYLATHVKWLYCFCILLSQVWQFLIVIGYQNNTYGLNMIIFVMSLEFAAILIYFSNKKFNFRKHFKISVDKREHEKMVLQEKFKVDFDEGNQDTG